MDYLLFQDLATIRSEWCGMAIVPTGWQHHRRNMDTSVFILGEQGTIELEEEGTLIRIEPGTSCILSAGKTHVGAGPCRDPVRYFWLHFQSASPPLVLSETEAVKILSHREIAKQRLTNALLLPQTLRLENSGQLREQFLDLLATQEKENFTPLTLQYASRLLLISYNEAILRHFPEASPGGISTLTGLMIQHIHEKLSDLSFSVKSMAFELGYHPDYLNRHFRNMMHQTLIDYTIDKRVELSARYLCDTNSPLHEISTRSGFSSYRNFVRQFILRKDSTPSEYRRRHRLMQITN